MAALGTRPSLAQSDLVSTMEPIRTCQTSLMIHIVCFFFFFSALSNIISVTHLFDLLPVTKLSQMSRFDHKQVAVWIYSYDITELTLALPKCIWLKCVKMFFSVVVFTLSECFLFFVSVMEDKRCRKGSVWQMLHQSLIWEDDTAPYLLDIRQGGVSRYEVTVLQLWCFFISVAQIFWLEHNKYIFLNVQSEMH